MMFKDYSAKETEDICKMAAPVAVGVGIVAAAEIVTAGGATPVLATTGGGLLKLATTGAILSGGVESTSQLISGNYDTGAIFTSMGVGAIAAPIGGQLWAAGPWGQNTVKIITTLGTTYETGKTGTLVIEGAPLREIAAQGFKTGVCAAGTYILVRAPTIGGNNESLLPSLSEITAAAEESAVAEAGNAVPGSGLGLRGPASRHTLTSVSQRTWTKDMNTVIEPGVDVAADVRLINQGQAARAGATFIVNGRTYGVHNGTLYPISGPGFHQLNRSAFQALGVFNKFGDTPKAAEILSKMQGIEAADIEAAKAAWRAGQ